MSPVQTISVQEKVIYVHEQDAVIITIRLYRVTRQDDFFEIITNLVQRGRFLGNLLVVEISSPRYLSRFISMAFLQTGSSLRDHDAGVKISQRQKRTI